MSTKNEKKSSSSSNLVDPSVLVTSIYYQVLLHLAHLTVVLLRSFIIMNAVQMDLESMNYLYPPIKDFVTALQDEGTMTKKKDDTKLVHKKINTISNELHKKLLKLDITGYPKNVSKASDIITSIIIQCRKQVDVVYVCVELQILHPAIRLQCTLFPMTNIQLDLNLSCVKWMTF
jgi:hypothetical protein